MSVTVTRMPLMSVMLFDQLKAGGHSLLSRKESGPGGMRFLAHLVDGKVGADRRSCR